MSDIKTSSGLGCSWLIAGAVLSWALNHSVGWAILHAILAPFYIFYAIFWRTKEILPALQKMFM